MDIEINEFIPNLPRDVFKAEKFGLPARKSYEEYLGIINRNMPPRLELLLKSPCLNCQDGSNNPSCEEGQEDPCDACPHQSKRLPLDDIKLDGYNEIYQEILYELVRECEESEREAGGDGASGTIRKIPKKKYSWQQVFRNITTAKAEEITAGYRYRSFVKPNRRLAHFSDVVFPKFFDLKAKISLVIIMDISGSMGESVNYMYGVMKSMTDILDIKIDITVLEVNAEVENVMHGFDLKKESIKSKDGGGTDMGAGILYVQENEMDPDLIVVMTDSCTPWPDPPILANKTVVLTDNPQAYNGPYTMFPVMFQY